ncbi:hypothetical protein EsDP_00007184 [Epichloe bromicola]|uniref:Uncharacterized protein n=1 Tax=Epichloe bromicola TaxID=79588 RepID=A0ABQ0CZT3_9HYPO
MSRLFGFRPNHPAEPSACGCYVTRDQTRDFLPQIDVNVHATILASTSSTILTQVFVNPDGTASLDEVCYRFPILDGVTIVHFLCTVNTRIIKGVVKERREARITYDEAKKQGKKAALLEQSHEASDVFTAHVGNVPPGAKVKVEITYLAELNHDTQTDAVRFTIPTIIAPRYAQSARSHNVAVDDATKGGGSLSITVDAEMPEGCCINKIESPSHPLAVSIGKASELSASKAESWSPRRASATLSLDAVGLDRDFVILIMADDFLKPSAILEIHPDARQRALMTTLVPRFNLAVAKPEVVFVCDRSGSMGDGHKIPNLVKALHVFLKSLPVGVRFNICSFGSSHDFLWERSRIYNQENLDKAVEYVNSFDANYGGTEMYQPVEDSFKRRCTDKNLEVFLITDGDIWHPDALFKMISDNVAKSNGAIRLFTLGVGNSTSSALIQGAARAGNGFSQTVGDYEKMDKKIIRMLKGALTPHLLDCAIEIVYDEADKDDDGFELVEKVMDSLSIKVEEINIESQPPTNTKPSKEPISFYNPEINDGDMEMPNASAFESDELSELPDMSPPRYLQTPFDIPALFPFIRTTVYVMLADSTPSREPKSVLLTGTCSEGPLRLEIPITKLSSKGTMIHQLAARKAVQELEEQRGWLFHAKNRSGKLLKDEFEDRFDRLVKREAVRMGIKHQVSGKWCSFVALEDDGTPETTFVDEEIVEKQPPANASTIGGGLFGGRASHSTSNGPVFGVFGGPPPPVASFSAATQGLGEPGGGLFGASAASYSAATPRLGKPGGGLFGASQAFTPFIGGPPPPVASDSAASGFGSAVPGIGSSTENHSHSPKQETDLDNLQIVTKHQTFNGSWTWTAELEKVLGWTRQAVADKMTSLPDGDTIPSDEVLVTLCVILFLNEKLAADKGTWELMVHKAEAWVEEQTGAKAAKLKKVLEGAHLFS